MSVRFEWDNPNQLFIQVEKLLRTQGTRIQQIPDTAIRRGVFELLAIIQKRLPKKTSTLVRSVTAVVKRISADIVEGTVGTYLEYARYLEEGTGIYGPMKRPIVIVPKTKQALFWGAYGANGKPLMAKSVSNPGIKPLGIFADSTQAFLPRYAEIIQEELAKAAA